jgi:hypothetical protein
LFKDSRPRQHGLPFFNETEGVAPYWTFIENKKDSSPYKESRNKEENKENKTDYTKLCSHESNKSL